MTFPREMAMNSHFGDSGNPLWYQGKPWKIYNLLLRASSYISLIGNCDLPFNLALYFVLSALELDTRTERKLRNMRENS